jgi:hypothetical protein
LGSIPKAVKGQTDRPTENNDSVSSQDLTCPGKENSKAKENSEIRMLNGFQFRLVAHQNDRISLKYKSKNEKENKRIIKSSPPTQFEK